MKIKKIEFYKVNTHITYNSGFKLVVPNRQVELDLRLDSSNMKKLFGRKKL